MCDHICLECENCENFKDGCGGQTGTFSRDLCEDIFSGIGGGYSEGTTHES